MRGQALVEFALILPIILFLALGVIQVGIAMTLRMELVHATAEAARLGAVAEAERCEAALDGLAAILGRDPDHVGCTEAGGLLSVTAELHPVGYLPGLDSWTISVTQRAAIR